MAKKKTRKRAASEGSIFQRTLPSGAQVWVGNASAGWRENGRRRRVTVYGATQAEVVAKLAQKRGEIASGTLADPGKLSLGNLCDRYLESAKRDVRATTVQLYAKAIEAHVKPHLGGAPLARVAPLHILDWLGTLERKQVGARMRQVAFDVLRRALAFGVDAGLL